LVLGNPLCAAAQSDATSHPLLDSDFIVGAGVYFPDKNFEIGVNGREPNLEIDFEEAYKLNDSETTWAVDFIWRFGEKWSVQGQYWKVGDSGAAVLEEDVEWGDVVFQQGTGASAGVDLDVARVFFGRKFSQGPQHEFGLGAGLHWMQIDAFVEGQILTSIGDTEFFRDSVEADAPLPNIGAWYYWSWAPKWALTSHVDWLSASIGDYSGSLWNASLGVNWALFDHFGLSAGWNLFKLDVDVEKSDWNGGAEISQNGPFVSLTAYW
jgi:hypothetical protein